MSADLGDILSASVGLDDSEYRAKMEELPGVAQEAMDEVAEAAESATGGMDEVADAAGAAAEAIDEAAEAAGNVSGAMDAAGVGADAAAESMDNAAESAHGAADGIEDMGSSASEAVPPVEGMDRTVAEAVGGMEKMTATSIGLSTALATTLVGAVKQAASAVLQFSKECLTEFTAQEDAEARLRMALKRVGGEYNATARRMGEFAAAMQSVTRYGEDTVISAMAVGLNMGIARDQIEAATKAAIGLASTYGMSLESSMQMIARAGNGMGRSLMMYGIQIDSSLPKTEQFAQVLAQCATMFGNAEEMAGMLGGKIARLGNQLGDLKGKIGQIAAGALGVGEAAVKAEGLIADLTAWLDENMSVIEERVSAGLNFMILLGQNLWEAVKAVGKAVWHEIEGIGLTWWHLMRGIIDSVAMVCNSVVNAFRSMWDTITTLSFDSWNDLFMEGIKADAKRAGEEFAKAFGAADESGNKIIDDFRRMNAEMNANTEAYWRRTRTFYRNQARQEQERIQERFSEAFGLGARGVESLTPQGISATVLGAFSSALLNAMLGSSSPERETARNTKRLVELAERNHGPIYE